MAHGRRLTLAVLVWTMVLSLGMPWPVVPQVSAAAFCDVPSGAPYAEAVTSLTERGIVRGYGDGCFGPHDTMLRAPMAALIARTAGWEAEDWGWNPFPDRGDVDADLWRNVATLAHYNVARGYEDGTYRPTEPVLKIQVISLITSAQFARGQWAYRPSHPTLYPNVTSGGGSLLQYLNHAGPPPDMPPPNQAWTDWDQPASREWTARAIWQALNAPGTTVP